MDRAYVIVLLALVLAIVAGVGTGDWSTVLVVGMIGVATVLLVRFGRTRD